MLFLLIPKICEVLSERIQQRARFSTCRASAARYFVGRHLRLQASESAYYSCWRMPVWCHFISRHCYYCTNASTCRGARRCHSCLPRAGSPACGWPGRFLLLLVVHGPCFTTSHRRCTIFTTSEVAMIAEVLILRKIIPCVPKSHQLQTSATGPMTRYFTPTGLSSGATE
jgi:hypothetical protein